MVRVLGSHWFWAAANWLYKKLSPTSHRGGPGSSPRQFMWNLWWTKWHWDRFSPSTSVSLANSHSIVCSTLIIYRPEWSGVRSLVVDVPSGLSHTPPPEEKNKKVSINPIIHSRTRYYSSRNHKHVTILRRCFKNRLLHITNRHIKCYKSFRRS
jgi:hypothetical protein